MDHPAVFVGIVAAEKSAVVVLGEPPATGAEQFAPLFLPVTMPLPRPPHLAEREELDAALALGSRDALEDFIGRHPQSRYRPEAESALKRLNDSTTPR